MEFIKLYHCVWDMALEPNALRTYCAILKFMNLSTGYANVKMDKLAAAVGISKRSIISKIEELEEKGLITVVKKYLQGQRIANGYLVTNLYGKYTTINRDCLNLPLTAFGFKTYLYLLKCADKKRKAFPSLSGLAKAIGSTIKTIITQIKELVKLGLIQKWNNLKRDNSYGHNQYLVYEESEKRVEKKAHLQHAPFQDSHIVNQLNKIMLSLFGKIVKTFMIILFCIASFFKKGYCNFCTSSKRTIEYYKLDKRIKHYCQYISKLGKFIPRE